LALHDAILAAAPALGVLALTFGPVAAWLAARRGRNPAIWLLFGALLGPLALGLIQLAPPARCWNCSEPTIGFESRCSTCGSDLRSMESAITPEPLVADRQIARPTLRAVPDPVHPATLADRIAANEGTALAEPGAEPVLALGARRPGSGPLVVGEASAEPRSEVTILAIGVLVRGSEPLLPGSRFLIARTHDRLHIIGPLEASNEHVALDLPLAGIEANVIADRLVITGVSEGRTRRTFVLAFQSVAGMTSTPVDEAIMESPPPISIAAGRR
jgi:hypothetical protein